MVKAYNGALIIADVLVLIFKILYYICESIYKLFVPAEEKSVVGEIVLVCISNLQYLQQLYFIQIIHNYVLFFFILVKITGAGHGIGKELALRYASLGATVICWDLNQQTNEETVNEIKEMGTTAAYAYQYVYHICVHLSF